MKAEPADGFSFWDQPRTDKPGLWWPAIASPQAAALLALEYQLERSQWYTPERILAQQLGQLQWLLRHALRYSPYYRDVLKGHPVAAGERLTEAAWRSLPVLTRAALQEAGPRLYATEVPKSHGSVHVLTSSGSTGRPVAVRRTQICSLIYAAFTIRDHIWHRRDPMGKLAVIRHSPRTPPGGSRAANWGQATHGIFKTGPCVTLHSGTDLNEQARWLERENPDYLLAYPSVVEALARLALAGGLRLDRLREVRTFGEALGPEVRDVCRSAWGVGIVDGYSSQEIGFLALQCPEHEHYHVQSETVLVEVLDDAGRVCGPGEVGRVVATPLHNFATPLLRYELGDYAEVGEPCPCGRGLPVLKRLMGRRRNLVRLADGRMWRPAVGITTYRAVAPVVQAQLVQTTLDTVEARLVVESRPTAAQEEQLRLRIQESLGHPFRIILTYVDAIPRTGRDKFEDFLCLV